MPKNSNGKYSEILENTIAIVFLFFMNVIFPSIALYLFGGVTDPERAGVSMWYFASVSLPAIVVLLFLLIEFIKTQQPAIKKSLGWAGIIFYDPEISFSGLFPSVTKFFTLYRLTIFSLFIFPILFMFSSITNTFFVGVPGMVAQQITETGQVMLSAEPTASSETILFLVLFSISINFFFWLWKDRRVISKTFYYVQLALQPLLFAVIWMLFHSARYGTQEVALQSTLIFGLMGGLTLVTFGTLLLWYIAHFFNNFYYTLNVLLPNDIIILLTVGYLVLLVFWVVIAGYVRKQYFHKSFI